MDPATRRFATAVFAAVIAARILAGLADTLSGEAVPQLPIVGALTLLSVPVAYYLAYRGGHESLRSDDR